MNNDCMNHVRDEAFYHFVWQYKLYRSDDLKTVCGKSIELIHPGLLNSDAGPDFFNVKIKIDDILWAGNVEIHRKSDDWQKHKHQGNKAYDNVILHVVAEYNTPIYTSNGSEIPTLVLDIFPSVYEQYDHLIQNKNTIACHKEVKNIDTLFWTHYRDRLVTERLQRKSGEIDQILEKTTGDWENVFFETLCRNFGFSLNADAFQRLGQSLSYKIIAKHRDNLMQIEALLFGQAGFLSDELDDAYYLALQKEYAFLKAKYELTPLKKQDWKFLRLRPGNFPTIRIAELAHLLHHKSNLLHHITSVETKDIEKVFAASTSPYWETHYQFGKLSDKRKKTLGQSAVRTILINTVSPILFCYGRAKGDEELCDKAIDILEQLPPESNHIVSKWETLGSTINNAYESQAHIQLYNEYCLHKKCLHCNIGHHYLSLQK